MSWRRPLPLKLRKKPKSKISKVFELLLFTILIVLSPVALIPFFMAANEFGPVGMFVMVALNGAIIFFGLRSVWQRWKILNAGGTVS